MLKVRVQWIMARATCRDLQRRLKPSTLEMKLQELEVPSSLVSLEQYATPAHIAATLLWETSEHFGSIRDEVVLDLGCGSGILAIGCLLLGSKFVVAVDVDSNSLEIAKRNAENLGFSSEDIAFVQQDIRYFNSQSLGLKEKIQTVVMNPPFGTKDQIGIDAVFVQKALECADTVYSMHKTSTRDFWLKKGLEFGVKVKPLTEVKFNIDYTFQFHEYDSQDIEVDFLQFKRI